MSINVTQCYQPLIFIHGLIHQRPTMIRSIRLVLVVGLSSKTWWHWVKLSWATEISTQQKTRWETQSLSSTVLGHDWVNSLKLCLILPRLVQIQNFLETISNLFLFFCEYSDWVLSYRLSHDSTLFSSAIFPNYLCHSSKNQKTWSPGLERYETESIWIRSLESWPSQNKYIFSHFFAEYFDMSWLSLGLINSVLTKLIRVWPKVVMDTEFLSSTICK